MSFNLTACEEMNSVDSDSNDIEESNKYKYTVTSYKEYMDVYFNELESYINEYKLMERFSLTHEYPYVRVTFYSDKWQTDESFKKDCKMLYDETIKIIETIEFKPKGIFKEYVIVQLHFGIHATKQITNEDIYIERGWINFDVDNEIPEFKYKD